MRGGVFTGSKLQRPVSTAVEPVATGWQLVFLKTGLNQLQLSNWTNLDQLQSVRLQLHENGVGLQLVAVASCPIWGQKTRPDWTLKHYWQVLVSPVTRTCQDSSGLTWGLAGVKFLVIPPGILENW